MWDTHGPRSSPQFPSVIGVRGGCVWPCIGTVHSKGDWHTVCFAKPLGTRLRILRSLNCTGPFGYHLCLSPTTLPGHGGGCLGVSRRVPRIPIQGWTAHNTLYIYNIRVCMWRVQCVSVMYRYVRLNASRHCVLVTAARFPSATSFPYTSFSG